MLQSFCGAALRPVCAALFVTATLLAWPRPPLRADAGARPSAASPAVRSNLAVDDWAAADLGTLDRELFGIALGAASCAPSAGVVSPPSTLTVIDYSRPSTARRLWVFDLRTRDLLYEEVVAHGQGSGGNLATMFSNQPETHQSSIGLFETRDTYVGKNGYSLRLNGLDKGFNDKALERAIVMHGAP